MNLTPQQLEAIVTALANPTGTNINTCMDAIHPESASDVVAKLYAKNYTLSCLPSGIYRTRIENQLKLKYIKKANNN